MNTLLLYINTISYKYKNKTCLYLTFNTIIWTLIGLIVWYIIHFLALNSLTWAICFAGYSGFFLGFVRGIITIIQ